MQRPHIWIWLVLAAAILLRVILVFQHEFWEDELWSVYYSTVQNSVAEMLEKPTDDRPPGYPIFIRGLVQLGLQEHALRIPSLLAGVLTIVILVKGFWKLNRSWGNWALITVGSSLLLIDASWQIREYAFLGLVAAGHIALWADWLQYGQKQIPALLWWLSWAVLGVVGISLNYVYVPFFAAMMLSWFILLLWWWRDGLITKLLAFKTLLWMWAAALPGAWLAATYLFGGQLHKMTQTTTWIPKPDLLSVSSLITVLLNWNNFIWEYRDPWPGEEQRLVFMVVFAVVCFGVLMRLLQAQYRQLWWFGWWGAGVVVSNLVAVVVASHVFPLSVFLPRFFTPLAVMMAALNAALLVGLPQLFSERSKKLVGVLVMSGCLLFFWHQFSQLYKIGTIVPYPLVSVNVVIKKIRADYQPGNQLVFLPSHLQRIMQPFYFPEEQFYQANLLYKQRFESAVSVTGGCDVWCGQELFVVVGNLVLDESSDFYAADNYDVISRLQLQQLRALCTDELQLAVAATEYSLYRCTLQ